MSELKLPTSITAASSKNPSNIIIFSKPKVGKTELASALPNALLIDLEKGSNYVSAMKMSAGNVKELKAIIDLIIKEGKPYTYVIIDTITALEDMCIPYAEQLYANSTMGKTWFTKGKLEYGTITNMPNGAGYPWLRTAFTNMMEYIKTCAPHVIFLGHVKDTLLEKNGSEFTGYDLDLTGNIRNFKIKLLY